MTILIVDDELLVRETLESCIDWKSIKIDQVLVASDGNEAFDIMHDKHVDILVSDIVMPNCTGIELVSRMRLAGIDIPVLFLSGYCEKKYLKEAIKLGIVDFLEKPLDPEEVKHGVLSIVGRLETTSLISSYKVNTSYADLMVLLNSYLKTGESLGIDEYFHRNEVFANYRYVAVLISDRIINNVVSLKAVVAVSQQINELRDCIDLHFVLDDSCLYVFVFSKSSVELEASIDIWKRYLAHKISCGWSQGVNEESMSTLIEEAEKARSLSFYDSSFGFNRFNDRKLEDRFLPENDVRSYLNVLDLVHVRSVAEEYFDRLERYRFIDVDIVKVQIQTLIDIIFNHICDECVVSNKNEFKLDILSLPSLAHIRNLFFEYFDRISAHVDFRNYSASVRLALQYIWEHYGDSNLQILDIAEFAGVSVPYLCRLFKKEVSTTIIKYVQQYRIEKSKTLLGNLHLTIGEIANSVGFADVNYYSKLFKQYVGCLPSSYRSRIVL